MARLCSVSSVELAERVGVGRDGLDQQRIWQSISQAIRPDVFIVQGDSLGQSIEEIDEHRLRGSDVCV